VAQEQVADKLLKTEPGGQIMLVTHCLSVELYME
jgi:hypothetical protein